VNHVLLSWHEAKEATEIGVKRQISNLKDERPDAHGFTGDGWGAHIEGALAEKAVAKHLDRYWLAVVSGDPKILQGDVGNLQVRSTMHASGRLILHKADPDGSVFISVIGPAYSNVGVTFDIVGAIRARDGKRDEWWEDPSGKGRPAYFVPRAMLVAVVDFV
jgi:hypothetical protein